MKVTAISRDDFAPLFPVRAAQKDAELIRDAAAFAGVQLDLAAAVRERFARVSASGRADDDMVATYHASFDG